MILRARFVLPVSRPPLENGAVRIVGDRIAEVGPWASVSRGKIEPVVDLGDSALLPGLVNAHCHLDYTGMAGLLPPRRSFSDWIKSIVMLKATWSEADFAASWQAGARMLVESGTTTVVDNEAAPFLLPHALASTPLRVISCYELISVRSRAEQLLADAVRQVEGWPNAHKGLSPHAPYTTSSELLMTAAGEARSRGWLLSVHIAESDEEFAMFTRAEGPMYTWLETQRNMEDCGNRTPVQHLETAGALQGLLGVHANYLTDDDISLLSQRQAHVAHCPRSHDYFGHQPFPFDALREAGVNVCLGTDSLATVHRHSRDGLDLNLFAEMRAFAGAHPHAAPREILEMATVNAARAIHLSGEIGEITPTGSADLIAIPLAGISDPHDAVLRHRGRVAASMIGGKWIVAPSHGIDTQ